MQQQHFGWRDALLSLLVFAIAATARGTYVYACTEDLTKPPPFQVQDWQTAINLDRGLDSGPRTDRDELVNNIIKSNAFACVAPLSPQVEETAHVAPGYPFLVAYLAKSVDNSGTAKLTVLWTQCALGALTAAIYLLFARLAFGSSLVGFLAGLLAAIHPFWLVNSAELQDGTLVSFLLACSLFLGTAAAQRGSPLASLLFGGSLAGMVLVRAALLPYGFIACLWVIWRCRRLRRGWICAVLVFLGFGNGLAPWTVRNFQVFGEVVPFVDSMFLHLWIGNNDKADGRPQGNVDLVLAPNPPDWLPTLPAEANQARRYRMLIPPVWDSVSTDPGRTIENRLRSSVCFLFGANWVWAAPPPTARTLSLNSDRPDLPTWVIEGLGTGLLAFLLAMLLLGPLGWRWSYNGEANLASLAMLWIPLPYILTHAENFSGPRLPLDGVLLTYTAFVLARLLAPTSTRTFLGPTPHEQ